MLGGHNKSLTLWDIRQPFSPMDKQEKGDSISRPYLYMYMYNRLEFRFVVNLFFQDLSHTRLSGPCCGATPSCSMIPASVCPILMVSNTVPSWSLHSMPVID